jgi:hydroxyethylthiazole kinase-like uncharacterized protein yjeF
MLAASAGLKAGAGYCEVFTEASVVGLVQAYRPSLVVRPIECLPEERLVAQVSGRPCAYVLGPGFDAAQKATEQRTAFVLAHAQAPLLVDGGALPFLATPQGLKLCKARASVGLPTVVTPHAGEAAQLASALGLSDGCPEQLTHSLSRILGALVVLKGPLTHIGEGDELYILQSGTAVLAKAGSGDVLAGVMGAFLAQGMAPFDAAVLAANLHADAGNCAAEALGPVSVTAEDLVDLLPQAIRALMAAHPEGKAAHQEGKPADQADKPSHPEGKAVNPTL